MFITFLSFQNKTAAVLLLRADPGLNTLQNVVGDDEKMLIDKISKIVLPEYYQPHRVQSCNSAVPSSVINSSDRRIASAASSTKLYSVASTIKLKSPR